MSNVLTIAIKDLVIIWRDKFGMFWILAFPLVFALFFGAIFGGGGDGGGSMTIAVVDEDNSEGSAAFIEALGETESLRLWRWSDDEPLVREQARLLVRDGRAVAYVLIPEGYGDSGMTMFTPMSTELEVGIDPARKAEAGFLEGMLMQAAFKRMQDGFMNPTSMQPEIERYIEQIQEDESIPPAQRLVLNTFMNSLHTFLGEVDPIGTDEGDAETDGEASDDDAGPSFNPIQIQTEAITKEGIEPPNAFAVSFPQAMSWGLIGCAAGFAIGLVSEVRRGTDLRLQAAPQGKATILAGKGLACFIACMLVIVLLIAFGAIFGVRVQSPMAFVMGAVSISFCFTGIMMLMSTLGKTEHGVAGAGWAAMMPMAMVGGGMVPLMIMPSWMQTLSHVSPIKWAILSLEGSIWRGFGPGEMLLPCGVLVGVGLAAFGLGVWVVGRRTGL